MRQGRSVCSASAQAKLKFTDERVCKNYLCGMCPYDLFANTKYDMGKCPKAHNEHQKLDYEEAVKTQDFGFEREWYDNIEQLVRERDKKIQYDTRELEESQDRSNDPVFQTLVRPRPMRAGLDGARARSSPPVRAWPARARAAGGSSSKLPTWTTSLA